MNIEGVQSLVAARPSSRSTREGGFSIYNEESVNKIVANALI